MGEQNPALARSEFIEKTIAVARHFLLAISYLAFKVLIFIFSFCVKVRTTVSQISRLICMSTEVLTLAIFGVVLVVLVVFCIGIYNKVQHLLNIIPEAISNISVLQKKRTDLISKLISIVDSYGIHESGITTKVSSDFGRGDNSSSGRRMVERLSSLRMSFPELKADSLYEALMDELSQVEDGIADRREQYNAVVRAYNTTLSQFPNNVLMSPFGFKIKPFLNDHDLNVKSSSS